MKTLFFTSLILILFSCENKTENIDSSIVVNNYSAIEDFRQINGGASMLFNETEYEFPPVEEGTELEHSFYFVNNGDAPLVLTNVKGSCGCTNVEYPEEPLNPGQKGVIKAEVNNSGKPIGKKFRVGIVVESNGQDSKIRLTLRGTTLEKK
ncbi:MAG: hypothetical protein CMP67_09785 [Flavobacteriales bacterium]|nr:hypothetical protein [Flavobacteriales bacterium]MBO72621.1 hypothetical protein [Flavobacteriales bacterium]|tara:strand:- start:808 stop:1260 length:453 start_codon:yes stop_codon:yes gene_type:complete